MSGREVSERKGVRGREQMAKIAAAFCNCIVISHTAMER